jgi:hypothetical protein
VAVVDHDALADPGGAERAVARVPDAGRTAVYRGWMMSSVSYGTLGSAPTARACDCGRSQYWQAHQLPGWNQALDAVIKEKAPPSASEVPIPR